MNEQIQKIVAESFDFDIEPQLTVPDEQFGDLATNVAMQLAGKLGKNPREIAEAIVERLHRSPQVSRASVAGPGFINITLTDQELVQTMLKTPAKLYEGQTIITEYSDMNAFKTAHIGHLFTTVIGNAIANICEHAGGRVIRANFGGDVGLHVGRAMWAIMKTINDDPQQLNDIPEAERSAWVAARYVEGTAAYESDEQAKAEIIDDNKRVYQLHAEQDKDSTFAQVYWMCREWSYDGFEQFYAQLQLDTQPDGSFFMYYPESTTAPYGKQLVEQGMDAGVFTVSDGAIVYSEEKSGLHTRVFLTSQGLPTYETKDLGLAVRKWEDHHYDQSIIITANDIVEYMKVVTMALAELKPELDGKTRHITHGLVKMAGGEKMSSRTGKVLLPEDVLAAARKASMAVSGKAESYAVIGAIKYAFLKNRIGGDVIYDPEESVSTQGNSGPYLQYAHARAKSILRKSEIRNPKSETSAELEPGERTLVRKLAQYADVIEEATRELAPHHICTYLYELAQAFNRFYEHNKVIGDPREATRVWLVSRYADTLKDGLELLGIHAPEEM